MSISYTPCRTIAISHPTTRHDGPDPQTKKKIPSRLNP